MAYPSQPNFGIADQDSAWWKVNNPYSRESFVCSTNGSGFIQELKVQLGSWVSGTLRQEIGDSPSARLMAPNGASLPETISLVLDGSLKWDESTHIFLAAWFRSVTGGAVGLRSWPSSSSQAYDQAVERMPLWAKTIHLLLRSDFTNHRISDATLRVAAWCVSYFRDLSRGSRLGSGRNPNAVVQTTDFSDIQVPDPIPPGWDAEIPGSPQSPSCSLERRPGDVVPSPHQEQRRSIGLPGYDVMAWGKILLVMSVAGVGGYMVASGIKGKRRRRR